MQIRKTLIHKVMMGIALLFFIGCTRYYDGEKSDHFDGRCFFDPERKATNSLWAFLKWQFTKNSIAWPQKIPIEQYDIPPSRVDGNELRVTNVGHVTYLVQTQGLNILTDPVWSERASPLAFLGPKRVREPGIRFEDLPPIDIVWVSHNHYDHLDLTTLKKLWHTHKPRIITPLGNHTIIKSIDKNIQVETYDWHESVQINEQVTLHLSPMQHWSARGIFDRNKALWAALTIETKGGNIYFVGDSGYGQGRYLQRDHQKFGPYRLALLPMGAYEPRWFMAYSHMNPEDFVLAHKDLGEIPTIPMHYGVFKLSDEGIDAPEIALMQAMKKHNTGQQIKKLKVGEAIFID